MNSFYLNQINEKLIRINNPKLDQWNVLWKSIIEVKQFISNLSKLRQIESKRWDKLN